MRQVKIAVLVGIGVLALCGVAVAVAVVDYVSHPEVANGHVQPVVATPSDAGPNLGGPAPPPAPAQAPPATAAPAAQPAAAPAPPTATPDRQTLLQLLHRRRRPPQT